MKPCPFCGEPDEYDNIRLAEYLYQKVFAAHCRTCGTIGPHGISSEEARARWNKRTDPDAIAIDKEQWRAEKLLGDEDLISEHVREKGRS